MSTRRKSLAFVVGMIAGDDGSGDIGVITEHALRDDPQVTLADLVDIVREAREEYALERDYENREEK